MVVIITPFIDKEQSYLFTQVTIVFTNKIHMGIKLQGNIHEIEQCFTILKRLVEKEKSNFINILTSSGNHVKFDYDSVHRMLNIHQDDVIIKIEIENKDEMNIIIEDVKVYNK